MNLGIGAVEAIDSHVHVESDGHGHTALDQQLLDTSARYLKAGVNRTPTLEEISDYYRERRLAAVVFTVDAHTATGYPALSSGDIVTQAAAQPACSSRSRRWTRTTGRPRSPACATWPPPVHGASNCTLRRSSSGLPTGC
jgi:hypothetical protein